MGSTPAWVASNTARPPGAPPLTLTPSQQRQYYSIDVLPHFAAAACSSPQLAAASPTIVPAANGGAAPVSLAAPQLLAAASHPNQPAAAAPSRTSHPSPAQRDVGANGSTLDHTDSLHNRKGGAAVFAVAPNPPNICLQPEASARHQVEKTWLGSPSSLRFARNVRAPAKPTHWFGAWRQSRPRLHSARGVKLLPMHGS